MHLSPLGEPYLFPISIEDCRSNAVRMLQGLAIDGEDSRPGSDSPQTAINATSRWAAADEDCPADLALIANDRRIDFLIDVVELDRIFSRLGVLRR